MQGLISRQAALDAMKDMYRAAEKWLRDATDDVTKARAESCMASLVEIKLRTEKLPAAQPDHVADVGKKVEGDCISRQDAIDGIEHAMCEDGFRSSSGLMHKQTAYTVLKRLPAVQPDHIAESGKKVEQTAEIAQNVQNEDLIQRKWLVECIEEGWVKFDTAKDCNRMMHLVRDIAPSVQPVLTCKGCRYDGHYTHMQCRNCLRKERDLYAPE